MSNRNTLNKNHMLLNTYLHTHTHTHTHTHVHAHTLVCTHKFAHIHVYTCTHTYTYTRTCTPTCTRIYRLFGVTPFVCTNCTRPTELIACPNVPSNYFVSPVLVFVLYWMLAVRKRLCLPVRRGCVCVCVCVCVYVLCVCMCACVRCVRDALIVHPFVLTCFWHVCIYVLVAAPHSPACLFCLFS